MPSLHGKCFITVALPSVQWSEKTHLYFQYRATAPLRVCQDNCMPFRALQHNRQNILCATICLACMTIIWWSLYLYSICRLIYLRAMKSTQHQRKLNKKTNIRYLYFYIYFICSILTQYTDSTQSFSYSPSKNPRIQKSKLSIFSHSTFALYIILL